MTSDQASDHQNKRLNILILDQGRQSLPFLKAYKENGHHVTIVCNTRFSEGYFSRYSSKRLIWPSYVANRQSFEGHLIEYLKNNEVDVTISLGDITADILSKNKDQITKYTNVTSPDYKIFIQGADKLKLMKYCMENNLPCPKTFELDDITVNSIANKLDFPVIVKPTRGVGAAGVTKFDNYSDLLNKYWQMKTKYGDLIVQEYIPQEGGMQYQAEAFADRSGKVKVCLVILKPRFFPVEGGTSTANVTIKHYDIEMTTRRLLEGLNWQGAADVDFILDPRDGIVKILEINPRVTAGIKIGFVAGVNFADLHLKLSLRQDIPEINDYKLGIYARNFFLEILWFLFSSRKMKKNTNPPFFKLYGGKIIDQVFSYDDPLAGLGFFLNMMRKYTKLSNFNNKFRN